MQAIIISVGDELVLGQTVDTNSAWLSSRLAECGITTFVHHVVPDDRRVLAAAVAESAAAAGLVIVSGGLGPTPDDLTRDVLAEITESRLILHNPSLDRIKRRFLDRNTVMPENCRIQAMIPDGAEIIENICGTAPGIKIRLGKSLVYALPGVPSEMKIMFQRSVLPDIESARAAHGLKKNFIRALTINTFGQGESTVAERLGFLMDRGRNPRVGITVSDGVVYARVWSCFNDREKATRELKKTAVMIRRRLGNIVFGEGDDTLQDAVGRLLKKMRVTLVTAESCTAGSLGKLLTDPPGASAWFKGGWIVYDNALKHKLLGVPMRMLDIHGAVSGPVAKRMAEGAIRRSGADYSLSLTGVAGPGGATPEKPVGTVWIALAERRGDDIRTQAARFIFPGSRECVRDRSAKTAINLLRLNLKERTK